jgi:Sulfotransferase domain
MRRMGRAAGIVGDLAWRDLFGGRFKDGEHAIAVFERGNEEVEGRVPAERLLVYEVRQGWGPLGEFLGVEAPEKPFLTSTTPRSSGGGARHPGALRRRAKRRRRDRGLGPPPPPAPPPAVGPRGPLPRHPGRHYHRIGLTVHPDNHAAQRLYWGAGFEPTGEVLDRGH